MKTYTNVTSSTHSDLSLSTSQVQSFRFSFSVSVVDRFDETRERSRGEREERERGEREERERGERERRERERERGLGEVSNLEKTRDKSVKVVFVIAIFLREPRKPGIEARSLLVQRFLFLLRIQKNHSPQKCRRFLLKKIFLPSHPKRDPL